MPRSPARLGTLTIEDTVNEALRLAAAIERDAEHPVARAIVSSARERELSIPQVADFEAFPGHGVHGRVDGRVVHVGGPNLLAKLEVRLDAGLATFTEDAASRGQGTVYLVDGERVTAALAVAAAVRVGLAEPGLDHRLRPRASNTLHSSC